MDCVTPPSRGGRRNPSVSSSRFSVAEGVRPARLFPEEHGEIFFIVVKFLHIFKQRLVNLLSETSEGQWVV